VRLTPGDRALFLRAAIDELVALGAGREGDGIIDVLDDDLETTPELRPVHGGDWVDMPAGRYRVVGLYPRPGLPEATIIETLYEGPAPRAGALVAGQFVQGY
jgi:hypothetical protein